MSTTNASRTDVTVMPLRFSDHVPQMREFLSLLGFSSRVSRRQQWVTMTGDSGMVALHDTAISSSGASSGQTGLSFQVADADALAARLADAGVANAEIHDEAWGRTLSVPGQLHVDERPTDLYGYRLDESRPEHGIVSMPIQFAPPAGELTRLLAAAGFVRLDEGDDEWWRVWRGTGGGLVALHTPGSDTPAGTVRLGFRTREPLNELADRLTAAGHADVTVSKDFGGELTVTDHDGQSVLVQPVS